MYTAPVRRRPTPPRRPIRFSRFENGCARTDSEAAALKWGEQPGGRSDDATVTPLIESGQALHADRLVGDNYGEIECPAGVSREFAIRLRPRNPLVCDLLGRSIVNPCHEV
jgi:hypothetical protein